MCRIGSQEDHLNLKCDPMITEVRKYNCSGPAPVYGDSLNKIIVNKTNCTAIANISITEDIETNWTNTVIYMKVCLRS